MGVFGGGKRRAQIVAPVKAGEEPSAPSSRKPSFAAARRVERNRRAKASWKQRQWEAMEYFSQQRKEELGCPFPVYTADSGRLTRRVFNANTGKNEELVIKNPDTGDDIRKEKMLRNFSGFSSKPTTTLKCGHCGKKGRIISPLDTCNYCPSF